jgi:hypothetical protein
LRCRAKRRAVRLPAVPRGGACSWSSWETGSCGAWCARHRPLVQLVTKETNLLELV